MTLYGRPISTDMNILATRSEWQKIAPKLPKKLSKNGYRVSAIHAEEINLSCEPDNMLVSEYEQAEGHPPVSEILHRVIITGLPLFRLSTPLKP